MSIVRIVDLIQEQKIKEEDQMAELTLLLQGFIMKKHLRFLTTSIHFH